MTLFRMRIEPWHALEVARVIEISGSHTLDDLHDAIQRAFELDDDHMYAFFMNAHAWDSEHGIWSAPEPGRASTAQARIGGLGLRRNKRFLYVFDFGDELVFDVRVETTSEERGPTRPRVVESIGAAPAQYPEDGEHDDDEHALHAHREPEPALADLARRLKPHVVEWQWPADDLDDDDDNATEIARAEDSQLEDAFALATELLDRTGDAVDRIHLDIEHAIHANVLGWLQHVPDALAASGRPGDALALAERLLRCGKLQPLRIALPRLLAAVGRADEARAAIEQNLEHEPDDARVLHETARAFAVLGEPEREEQCLRDALAFAGTRPLRRDVVARLTELLAEGGRAAEIETLRRAETERRRRLDPARRGNPDLPVRVAPKIGRNEPCPCGSGKKHKKCCGAAARTTP